MAQDPSTLPPFDLAPEGVLPPLDLPTLPGMTPSPPPQQARQQPRGNNPLAQLGPMLPLIAAAMKQGGRAGLAGFLQGVQQARARKQQQARLGQQDARTAAQDERAIEQQTWQRGVQDQQLAAAAQQRQQQMLQQFHAALGNVDDPEAVRALLELYGPQADSMGVGRQRLETFANQTATPTTLQKRKAERIIADLEKQHGDKWITIGPSFSYRVPGEEQPIGFEEVLRRSGRSQTAPLPAATNPNAPNTPEEQFYQTFARENGAQSFGELPSAKQGEAKAAWAKFGREPQAAGGAGGQRPMTQGQRASVINARRSQWQRFTTSVVSRQQAVAKVDQGVAALDRGNRNAATQAIILAFNKLQDETSVVREGEYARSEDLAPVLSRIEGAFIKITAGGGALTDADLRALAFEAKETAKALERISTEAATNLRQGIEEELADYGIPVSRVFGNSTLGVRQSAAPGAGGAVPNQRPTPARPR